MSARYDVEELLRDLADVCKAKLNTRLAAITAEKVAQNPSDALTTLAQVPDGAYFFQSLDKSRAAAHPVFMFWGLEDPVADGAGPYTIERLSIFFIVVVKDTAEQENYMWRLMRYSRALKEIFEENFSKNRGGVKLSVSSLSPVGFDALGMPGSFKAVGVRLSATIG